MAEILIHVNHQDYSHADPEKDESGVYKRGYIVDIQEDSFSWGSKEGLPRFVKVNVTDADVAGVQSMVDSVFGGTDIRQSWNRKIDFANVNSNLTIDGWRIRVFALNPGSTNKGGVTQTKAENYLNKWNASVNSATANEVVFDVAIFEDASNNPGALQSTKFWNFDDISNLTFTENSYNETSGVHEIELDYSAEPLLTGKDQQVATRVLTRGATIISHEPLSDTITFSITRNDVFQHFKEEVRQLLETAVYRTQFRIPEATVNTIVSGGGTTDVTLATLQGYLINRLDEDL